MNTAAATPDAEIHEFVQSIVDEFAGDGKDTVTEDLAFFKQLICRVETNIAYWNSHHENVLALAQAMNEAKGRIVDPVQLEAAVYMHDIGLAFTSRELLHKENEYTAEEKQQMSEHVMIAVKLLERHADWAAARQMIEQHHEWIDGNGYPGGIEGDAICDGAKILAIVDAFESMTHNRPHRNFKRSLMNAVKEINRCSGTQFCHEWVKVFNLIIRDKFVKSS
jgi:HD-GYP domain-containing protein (c-di-GMP phosphodiesterase class II)